MTPARRFANDVTAVTAARRFAYHALHDQPPEIRDTVELLVSELASNCVRHTDSEFALSIDRQAGEIRVAATDWGAGEPVRREPDPTALSGRGLVIIETLADTWGVERERAGRGKTVWFTLPAGERSR